MQIAHFLMSILAIVMPLASPQRVHFRPEPRVSIVTH